MHGGTQSEQIFTRKSNGVELNIRNGNNELQLSNEKKKNLKKHGKSHYIAYSSYK